MSLARLQAPCRALALMILLAVGAAVPAQEPEGPGQQSPRAAPAQPRAVPAPPRAVPAQQGPQAASARPRAEVTAEEIEALRDELRAGVARLTPLLEAVDVAPAEAWLAASTLEALAKRAAELELEDAVKAAWQAAADHEQAAVERVRGALARAEAALGATQRLEALDGELQGMLEPAAAPGDGDEERSLTETEEDIAALNGRRAQIALELDQRRQTLARLEEQLRSQAGSLDELRRAGEEELAAAGAGAQSSANEALAEAEAAARDALDRRNEARIVAAQLDAETLPARLERLRLELRVQELEERRLLAQLAAAQAEYVQRSTEELRTLTSDLQRLIEREPDVQRLHAAELAAMRRQIDEIADVQERVRALQLERQQYARIEEDLTQTLANVRERLEVGGLTETLGGLFLEEQRRLRALGDTRFELKGIERELEQSRLDSITLRERLRAAPAPEAGVEPSAEIELLRIRHQLAAGLLQAEDALTDQLGQTEVSLRAVVALRDELDQILRETLLWWPSHVPVSVDWAARIPAAFLALADTSSWREIRSAVRAVTVGSPAGMLLTLLAVGLLLGAGRRTGSHLRALGDKTRHRFTDNMGLTVKAMGWSLLRVLPVPVLLMCTSYRLKQLPEAGQTVEILAAVLFSAAIWWLAGYLVVLFISRNGVGTVHLEWNPCMVQRLRRNLAWYLPIQFALVVALALAFAHPSDLVLDVLGRAALVVAAAAMGLMAWRLLEPSPELTPALTDARRRFARIGAVGGSAVLVILALAGYLLTVAELYAHLIDTAVVAGLVWLGYRLGARALILSETRLRLKRLLEQRTKAAAAETNSAADRAPELPEPQLSMEDINLQTRTLVRLLAGGFLVLALFGVWAEVLPALTWLDGVTLWSRTAVVGDSEIVTRMSVQDLLLAVFLVVLFSRGARNLPGLVEILLARSTQMDGAARYTVTTLLRYAIMVVAVVSVFSLVGLRWSELQWLVAALTLGLGFGLQEVVANFVSGLIMLFERPVRVGDTITIGEFSGTVARIRTRATTIIDWDNREIVVPNKNFITERLINWTLSDTMTRIVLSINVGYGEDVDLVMRVLKDIAEQHPVVMEDPAPTVFFMKFGDSALNFELRAYVNQLRERLETVSDLHRQIVKEFREHGIEIAVPKMDLRIRDTAPAPDLAAGGMSLPALGTAG